MQLSSNMMRSCQWRRGAKQQKQQQHSKHNIIRCTPVRAVSTATDSLAALIEWAEASKIATDRVATAEDLDSGARMLVAARDAAAGDALLTIPEQLWVSPQAAEKAPRVGPKLAGLEPWLQLALLLLHERSNSGGSGVIPAAYLASLDAADAASSSPLLWTEQELAALAGTQLLQTLRGYRAYFRATWEQLDGTLFASDRSLFPEDAFSYEAFLWAAATVRGRAHAPLDGAGVALAPLADALPHRRGGACAWRVKSAGLLGRGRALVVEATRAVRKGEALAMDYGPGRPDSAVLLDYGILDATAPRPGYTLALSLPESDRYRDDKLDVLERNGLSGAQSFVLRKGEAPSEEMLGFLRLTALEGGDCFLLEPIFEADVWSFMCAPVSQANEAAVAATAAAGLRAALAAYPTTIEDDLAALRGGDLPRGSRAELAVRARLGEMEALDGALAWFEARAGDLNELEYYQERRLKRLGLLDDDGKKSTTYDSFFQDGIA